MVESLKAIATEEQKKTLRKISETIQTRDSWSTPSKAPDWKINVTAGLIVKSGCLGNMMAYQQYIKDCILYGLWEALLYVEGYESKGYYKPGTAHKAFIAVCPEEK